MQPGKRKAVTRSVAKELADITYVCENCGTDNVMKMVRHKIVKDGPATEAAAVFRRAYDADAPERDGDAIKTFRESYAESNDLRLWKSSQERINARD